MVLLPIDIDETNNKRFFGNQECLPVLKVYPDYYEKIGFNRPWIGYFASTDGEEIVGAAGYKGKPKDGKIEIAYGTFKKYEGHGIGTEICRQLVLLALQADPSVKCTNNSRRSCFDSYLKKNGFHCLGIVHDEEDGDVFEWELIKKSR